MANWKILCNQILQELETDRAFDDVTGRLLEKEGDKSGQAVVSAKAVGVFSGAAVAQALQEAWGDGLKCASVVAEGQAFAKGDPLVRLSGSLRTLLAVERTLINLVSHLCGVATLTRQFVDSVKGHPVRILATRKTLLGLRDLQLTAVRAGGGFIHRRSLSDGILIKDNHQDIVDGAELVRRARVVRSPLHRIEVEVQSLDALRKLLGDPPEVVMLDNFSLADMKQAVSLVGGKCELEVSGGVDLTTVKAIASLGVQYISVGKLTHSAVSVDMSMDLIRG